MSNFLNIAFKLVTVWHRKVINRRRNYLNQIYNNIYSIITAGDIRAKEIVVLKENIVDEYERFAERGGKIFHDDTDAKNVIMQALSSARLYYQARFLLSLSEKGRIDLIENNKKSEVVKAHEREMKLRNKRIEYGKTNANTVRHNSMESTLKLVNANSISDYENLREKIIEIAEINRIDYLILANLKFKLENFPDNCFLIYLKDKTGFYPKNN